MKELVHEVRAGRETAHLVSAGRALARLGKAEKDFAGFGQGRMVAEGLLEMAQSALVATAESGLSPSGS